MRAGDLIPARYTLHSNHKGLISWIVTSADCGDHAECFEPTSDLGKQHNATILEFDDTCNLPTLKNMFRTIEPTGQTCNATESGCTYGPLVRDDYQATENRREGAYFGDEGSPYGAEYVKIPVDLPRGNYTMMLKWLTSGEQRIFASCADIEVLPQCDVVGCIF